MSKHIEFTIKGYSMYPSYTPGETIVFDKITKQNLKLLCEDDLVLFNHPFKENIKMFKRIKSLSEDSCFVSGDNPDPTSSFDSHNFGPINKSNILAYKKENLK